MVPWGSVVPYGGEWCEGNLIPIIKLNRPGTPDLLKRSVPFPRTGNHRKSSKACQNFGSFSTNKKKTQSPPRFFDGFILLLYLIRFMIVCTWKTREWNALCVCVFFFSVGCWSWKFQAILLLLGRERIKRIFPNSFGKGVRHGKKNL